MTKINTMWCPRCGMEIYYVPVVKEVEYYGNIIIGNFMEIGFANLRINHTCADKKDSNESGAGESERSV